MHTQIDLTSMNTYIAEGMTAAFKIFPKAIRCVHSLLCVQPYIYIYVERETETERERERETERETERERERETERDLPKILINSPTKISKLECVCVCVM